jgi:hypothetical protein
MINKFESGRDLWHEYLNLNGYSFCPTEKGLSNLSKTKNIKKSVIRKLINDFLSA